MNKNLLKKIIHKIKYNRITLFLSILWRRWDADCERIDWKTAWEVCNIVYRDSSKQ